jgi:predicted branched-subunit amino acid permease
MIFGIAAAAFGRWTHDKPAASVKLVVEATFAVLLIAFMDQGESEPVAKGLAYLFLAAVLLGADSPISGLTSANFTKTAGAPTTTTSSSTTNTPRSV